jgi:hypothetical protein
MAAVDFMLASDDSGPWVHRGGLACAGNGNGIASKSTRTDNPSSDGTISTLKLSNMPYPAGLLKRTNVSAEHICTAMILSMLHVPYS